MNKKETYASKYLGQKINRLTILSVVDLGKRNTFVVAVCECGVKKNYTLSNIVSGHTTSCGCAYMERSQQLNLKHGHSKSPLYKVWAAMKERNNNPTCQEYANYGGRGVKVCDEWNSGFIPFYEWAKDKYKKGLELDKDIKGDGMLYSPETCSFVTKKVNAKYKRTSRFIEYNGEYKILREWVDLFKKDYATVFYRLKKGWSVHDAFTLPPLSRSPLKKTAA